MTTQELIAAIRVRLDDQIVPYLASTATILEQLSLTQTEFARSTLALFSVASGTITAANPWLTLPTDMFLVKVVILNGLQLRAVTSSELDFGYSIFNNTENEGSFGNWRAATGTPKFIVVDMYSDKVRLVPTPTSSATVSIEGFIVPPDVFYDGVATTVNPQIPEVYHEVLMAGTLSRLYTLFEIDILNPSKAQLYAAQWQQGLVEAQNILQTPLRRQMRLMELSRGFSYLTPPVEQKA